MHEPHMHSLIHLHTATRKALEDSLCVSFSNKVLFQLRTVSGSLFSEVLELFTLVPASQVLQLDPKCSNFPPELLLPTLLKHLRSTVFYISCVVMPCWLFLFV